MKYEKVSFSDKFIAKFNTADEFINHVGNRHLWPELTVTKRKERLREVYKLAKASAKANKV